MGWPCASSLLFDLRPNYVGGNENNADLLQQVPCKHCCTQCPQPCTTPPLTMPLPETPGRSWASLSQFFLGSLLLSPGSWCTQGFVCALQESVTPLLCKFWQLYGGVHGDLLQEGLCHTHVYCTQSPCPCSRPPPTHASPGDSWTLMDKSGAVSCGVTAPFSWVLMHTRFCLCPLRVCFPSPV